MVRKASFDSNGMKKGAWSEEEDNKLRNYIQIYGHPNWCLLPILAGLARCGKSCRLRWVNYLKPGLKRGNFTKHERDLVIKLHAQLGNKWSAIAAYLPGRTDNEVKNYWHAHIHKRRNKRNATVPNVINKTKSPSDNVNILKGFFVENVENIDVVSSATQADQCNKVDLQGLSVENLETIYQGNNVMSEEFYQTCYGDSSTSEERELIIDNFRLSQEMQNNINMLTLFSECSDGGYSTAESQLGDFLAEQAFGEEAISWSFGDIMDMLY